MTSDEVGVLIVTEAVAVTLQATHGAHRDTPLRSALSLLSVAEKAPEPEWRE